MQLHLSSERLNLAPIQQEDKYFIFELLNSPLWLKFIGDRKIHSIDDASNYILRIKANSTITYWIVTTKTKNETIGIISFIKRDYLEYHDIGFAFLPQFSKQGYAYESTNCILKYITYLNTHKKIFASTIKENFNSINLLAKLGFKFLKTIEYDNQKLNVYEVEIRNFNN